MYGGLFGDLPAAKNSSSGTSKNDDDESKQHDGKKSPAAGLASKKSSRDSPSAVKGLGVAGTSMAFVPTAARQRNKGKQQSKRKFSSTKDSNPTQTQARKADCGTDSKTTQESSQEVSTSTEDGKVSKDTTSEHELPTKSTTASSLEEVPDVLSASETTADDIDLLHQSVIADPYDPLVPNDLLQYWDQKAIERERMELERAARETLERQERLRLQLEREREELEKAGDLDKLIEHRTRNSMGGGRGRGLSNLPAWLVERQKKENSLGSAADQPFNS